MLMITISVDCEEWDRYIRLRVKALNCLICIFHLLFEFVFYPSAFIGSFLQSIQRDEEKKMLPKTNELSD